jgi:hypothetical protein
VSADVSEEHTATIFRVEKLSSAINQHEASRKQRSASRLFLAQLIFSTLKVEEICSSETSVDTLHGVISQKMVLFITTAERTSNPSISIMLSPWSHNRSIEMLHDNLPKLANKNPEEVKV